PHRPARTPPPRASPPAPTRRSSDLATARWVTLTGDDQQKITGYFDKITKDPVAGLAELDKQFTFLTEGQLKYVESIRVTQGETEDRKSTRLNSSHVSLSYAVFCFKK